MLTAKKGKSLTYRQVAAILAKRQKPKWVEITVLGKVVSLQQKLGYRANVTGERFFLSPEPKPKPSEESAAFQKLQEAIKARKNVISVTGKVQEAKDKKGKPRLPATLLVTGFKAAKE